MPDPVDQMFASSSVPRHLLRGAIGLAALVGTVVLVSAVGPLGLLLLPVAGVALRGCPTCWTLGLMQTIAAGRVTSCPAGGCAPADRRRDLVSSRAEGPGRDLP